MGEKAGSTRPTLVKLLLRKTTQQVIQKNKQTRKLKNTKPNVVFVEDLSKSNYNLFLFASNHPGALRAWTSDGKVLFKAQTPKFIRSRSCLTYHFPAMPPPSHFHPCRSHVHCSPITLQPWAGELSWSSPQQVEKHLRRFPLSGDGGAADDRWRDTSEGQW